MDDMKPAIELLTLHPMPKLAQALRDRHKQIVARWDSVVQALLPNADPLTTKQVRNSIPVILAQMAAALEADDPRPTEQLMEVTKSHGSVRFHESYNVRELIEEYRLLRRILVEEIDAAFSGVVSTREWIALDMAIDIALQQAVVSFIDHQMHKLTAATEAEGKYLAFMAHDMRNGLNTILLTMQWVEQSLEPLAQWSEHVDALRSARVAAEETISGMERLLQAERLRKGVMAKREQVNLRQVLTGVASAHKAAGDAKQIRIDVEVPGDPIAHTDAGLLSVILQNLVGNAVKYSEHGTIHLRASRQHSAWTMEVADGGPGIAQEQLQHIFDAFTRGDTHGQDGVGLGLYIAAQSARALGGRLTVESTLGKGSAFRLLLPDDAKVETATP